MKAPVGERASQSLLAQLCFDTWAVALVADCAVTVRVWETGAVPPAAALKVKAVELNERGPEVAAVTLRLIRKIRNP